MTPRRIRESQRAEGAAVSTREKSATPTQTPWLSLRLVSGLSQREVERRLGWTKRGHLSLIERGVGPTAQEAYALRVFYTHLVANMDEASS